MEIKINIEDAIYPRFREAFCARFNYDLKKKADETKTAFVLRMIKADLLETARRQEILSAARDAKKSAEITAKEIALD